jgi:hypothetical protein
MSDPRQVHHESSVCGEYTTLIFFLLIQNPHNVAKRESIRINVGMHSSWWYTSRYLGGSEITCVRGTQVPPRMTWDDPDNDLLTLQSSTMVNPCEAG